MRNDDGKFHHCLEYSMPVVIFSTYLQHMHAKFNNPKNASYYFRHKTPSDVKSFVCNRTAVQLLGNLFDGYFMESKLDTVSCSPAIYSYIRLFYEFLRSRMKQNNEFIGIAKIIYIYNFIHRHTTEEKKQVHSCRIVKTRSLKKDVR
jgi:hypothetical protein